MEEVKEPVVEETTPTESSPVEPETTNDVQPQVEETQVEESPADTSVEPEEKEVSKTIPYERFQEINNAKKAIEEENAYLKSVSQPQNPAAELDEDSARAVRNIATQQFLDLKATEFRSKHGAELKKNEMLDIAFERELRKQRASGTVIDPDGALTKARGLLDASVKPVTEAAKKEGLKEGQDIAKTKQQLGAVGTTGKQPTVDPVKDLTADEYLEYHGIKPL